MATVVGVEDLPVLEVRDDSFNGCPERREGGVVLLVTLAQFSSLRFLSRCREAGSLVAFIADSAARVADNLGDRGFLEFGFVVGVSRKRVAGIDRGSIQEADQLRVEPGGAVLAAP